MVASKSRRFCICTPLANSPHCGSYTGSPPILEWRPSVLRLPKGLFIIFLPPLNTYFKETRCHKTGLAHYRMKDQCSDCASGCPVSRPSTQQGFPFSTLLAWEKPLPGVGGSCPDCIGTTSRLDYVLSGNPTGLSLPVRHEPEVSVSTPGNLPTQTWLNV